MGVRTDGQPPLEGKALVFHSLEYMLEHFQDLWDCLSKPGIQQKNLQQRLLGNISRELPPKLSVGIVPYPGTMNRSAFQTDLHVLSDWVIADVGQKDQLEPEFLKQCYCPSGALSQYALVSKAILQARYAALFDSAVGGPTLMPSTTKEGLSREMREMLADSLSNRPILLLGDVGVGKTTFIRYLMNVDATPLFENAIALYLDMGSKGTISSDLREFILDEVTRQLRDGFGVDIEERDFVHAVYKKELEGLRRGIFGDLLETDPKRFKDEELEFLKGKLSRREQYLSDALRHIAKGRRKQIVIFLDNADQRSDDTQQQAFLIAEDFAKNWPATVFVALRPETFHRPQRAGVLSGYHPKAFTIAPPRVDLVITKRLEFARNICDGVIPAHIQNEEIQVNLVNLSKVIWAFLYSLGYNDQLVTSIDNICAGNIRAAIDWVKGFFGSAHVDTQKIVKIVDEDGCYNIPVHEFLRAICYGDTIYYDPNRSPIANLFDVRTADQREHFLMPLIITFLIKNSDTGDGFVEMGKLYDHIQGLGFSPEQIDLAITRGYDKKLLETSARQIPVAGQVQPFALRVSTAGHYHVSQLCNRFVYIDAVVVDTPIFDNNIFRQLEPLAAEWQIMPRLERAEIFRNYINMVAAKMELTKHGFNWNLQSALLDADIRSIRQKNQRPSGR